MNFAQLYNHVNGLTTDNISVKEVANFVVAHHDDVGEVNFWPVELDPDISLGHIKYERDRSSPYDAEFSIANIRFDKCLNRCWRRFVCCKELMHVFDTADQRVDTRDRFVRLMGEFEAIPIPVDASPMFLSELWAEWKALIVLCPQRLREKYIAGWQNKTLSDFDIALKLKIPETVVSAAMGGYYLNALVRLVEKPE